MTAVLSALDRIKHILGSDPERMRGRPPVPPVSARGAGDVRESLARLEGLLRVNGSLRASMPPPMVRSGSGSASHMVSAIAASVVTSSMPDMSAFALNRPALSRPRSAAFPFVPDESVAVTGGAIFPSDGPLIRAESGRYFAMEVSLSNLHSELFFSLYFLCDGSFLL